MCLMRLDQRTGVLRTGERKAEELFRKWKQQRKLEEKLPRRSIQNRRIKNNLLTKVINQ